jgi:hypothetical protein
MVRFDCCKVASYYGAGYRFATCDVAILWHDSMKGQRALRCSSKRLYLDGDMRQGRESRQSFLVGMRFVRERPLNRFDLALDTPELRQQLMLFVSGVSHGALIA